jgi:hemolysin activation/secretion protein
MKSVLFTPSPLHQVYYFCILVLALLCSAPANAQDERFNIVRFNIVGNTLLPASEMEKLVAPMIGQGKVYGDIQKALEAIEGAYRQAGWSTVDVHVPEQELTEGVIRIDVTENVIGKVEISGNTYFDNANIRAGLVALKEGKVPNLREMSEGIQLSNENPAKQLEVTLGAGEEEGQVDAKILVTEENPKRVYMTLDDTGKDSHRHRLPERQCVQSRPDDDPRLHHITGKPAWRAGRHLQLRLPRALLYLGRQP